MSGGKQRRYQSCNVLQIGAAGRRIWNFDAGRKDFALKGEEVVPAGAPLPEKVAANDWRVIFQTRLNVAVLPADKVFLRVAQLPAGTFDETRAMVELQLEKFSPLPVTQVVWTFHVLPQMTDNLQTVIVIIVSRDVVEEFIGQLEGQGYLAERLALPLIDQLEATPVTGDGAWIYPTAGTGSFSAVVAWWYGGVLRDLALLHLPATEDRATALKEQLSQMTWAGELEGWLTSQPRLYLVADEATAGQWQPMFRQSFGREIELVPALPAPRLIALTARRAAQSDPRANIMPLEFATRYRQQLVDRLWMGGLEAVLAVYLIGLVIYFTATQIQGSMTQTVVDKARTTSLVYTNALQIKAQLKVLEDQQALKFAALDCWKTVAELLPESMTIRSFEFKSSTLTLTGTAPAEQGTLIIDFNKALNDATLHGEKLFSKVSRQDTRNSPGGTTQTWTFVCELANGEAAQ